MTDSLSEFVKNTQNAPSEHRTLHSIEFKGNTKDYFGIWIVNVALSIVTLGIYSAWAKVRNKKYFSGVTFIDGHNFDYHATGKQILLGRLIVLFVYGIFYIANFMPPYVYITLSLIVALCMGWVIKNAIRFNARMTSYRNVRFNFEGTSLKAWIPFILYPFLLYLVAILPLVVIAYQAPFGWNPGGSFIVLVLIYVLAVSFLYPFISRSIHRYTANNYRYGDRAFKFDSPMKPYFMGFLKMIGLIVLVFFLWGLGTMIFGGLIRSLSSEGTLIGGAPIAFWIFYPLFLLSFFAAGIVYRVARRNILFSNAILDDKHEFVSTFETPEYMGIIISNVFAILFTLGLATPWARVRLARYVAENTKVLADGDLGGYSSSVIETHGVTAAEYTDLEGFDIDIGIGI